MSFGGLFALCGTVPLLSGSHCDSICAPRVYGRTLKKRLLVSMAAPSRGALIPRYKLQKPSFLIDCRKQSRGPLYSWTP